MELLETGTKEEIGEVDALEELAFLDVPVSGRSFWSF